MSPIAVAELDVPAPVSEAFAHFVDFTRWSLWMPHTFSPHTGPKRALQAGDKFKVRFRRLPISLEVLRLRQNGEVCWRGGSRLIVQGDHSYTFAEAAGKTRIRSEEKLSGLLTLGPLGPRLERSAAAASLMILQRFANYLAQPRP